MHPEIAIRQDALLWSINERLAGREGLEIAPITDDWMHELVTLEILEHPSEEDDPEFRMPQDEDDLEYE